MDAQARLGWVRLDEQVGNAAVACRRCGISRPTLRKSPHRYQAEGEAGLEDRSRRPHHAPQRQLFEREEALVLKLRRERKLGSKQLTHELSREHGLRLAPDTVHKVLARHGEDQLKRPRLQRQGTRRYTRPVPGDRVQMDSCKKAPGLYQFTAIDDRTRFQVLGLYRRRNAASTRDVLDRVAARMPFPLQRIQTDRGGEFFADEVQQRPCWRKIKYRPVKPRSPHLNGLETAAPSLPPGDRPRGRWSSASSARRSRRSGRPSISRTPTSQPGWRPGAASTTPEGLTAHSAAAHPMPGLTRSPTRSLPSRLFPSKEFIRITNTRYRWIATSARVT
jgi:transposase